MQVMRLRRPCGPDAPRARGAQLWQIRPGMAVDRTSRIVVAGAGSIGCYVGGCLALAGRNVTLLLRPTAGRRHRPARPAHLRPRGRRPDIAIPGADARDRPGRGAGGGPDRARHRQERRHGGNGGADRAPRPRRGDRRQPAERRRQCSMSCARSLCPRSGLWRAWCPSTSCRPAKDGERPRFHRATSGTMLIAAGVAGLREALDVPGAAVAEHADMTGVLWGKLLLNLNNALNALADLPLAKELADRRWRLLLAAQIEEALAVLKAADMRPARIEGVPPRAIPLDPAPAQRAVPPGGATHAGHRPASALVHVGGLAAAATDRDRPSAGRHPDAGRQGRGGGAAHRAHSAAHQGRGERRRRLARLGAGRRCASVR